MKNWTKQIALLLAVVFCFALAACGQAAAPAADPAPAEATDAQTPQELEPGVNGEVVISHWGGSTADAYRQCYFNDFEKETGIKVVEVIATNNKSQLQAMVDTNSVEVDIMQGSELELNYFRDRYEETGVKYIADIDFSVMDADEVAGLTRQFPNAIDAFGYASVIAYSLDAFTEDNHPNTWADFWDVEKFPGMRTIVSGVSGDYPPLEMALLADGVALDALYPVDIERAFAKLDELDPYVLKYWMSGADPVQMLLDGEVTVAEGFSGRFATAIAQGANIGFTVNEGALNYDCFFVPEGDPNYDNAMKLLSYMIQAERQAKFAELTNYAPSNARAYDYLEPTFAASLPTAPENITKMYTVDNQFWADNMLQVQDMWLAWEDNG